jgi:hypothetical protein
MRTDAGLYWSDDALLRRALGTTRAEVKEKAEDRGWDPALTETTLRRQTSQVLVAAIEAAVERAPDRAQVLRTRYDQSIEAADRVALDALLAEAQTRRRAEAASTEILNTTPPNGEQPTPQWRFRQAEAIADPSVRAAAIRRLTSAATADEARARALAEQVLARVLKEKLTDPSQIPVREWVALDADRRRVIETRLDHNAAGTEPAPNPALVGELAGEMTQAPHAFARRDLIPAIAHLPLPLWQRFRDWQAGLRRDDPATEDQLYAFKRGLQLATKMLPADMAEDEAMNTRAALVEEIDTWRRIGGKSPDDDTVAAMVGRQVPDQRARKVAFPFDPGIRLRLRPGVHQIQDTTTYGPSPQAMRALEALIKLETLRRMDEAMRSLPRRELDPEIVARALEMIRVTTYPSRINPNGQVVYYDPRTGRYVVRNTHGGTGYWVEFDAQGGVIGTASEGLISVERSAQPPADELKKIWQNPPLVPPEMPPAALPGRPIEPPRLPDNKGYPAPEPRKPEILTGPSTDVRPGPVTETFPRPDVEPPTILEIKSTDDHHNIPQFLWSTKRGRKPKYIFSVQAKDYFDEQIVPVPRNEHWGRLHAAYNRAVERAMQAYLEEAARKAGVTVEEFAANMSDAQAKECHEYIKSAIKNAPATAKEEVEGDNEAAKQFLKHVERYEKK